MRRALIGMGAGLATLTLTTLASAQEILLTGPLAGAPAVRKLRLYREGRFEVAPAVGFTLLDEYQRTIMPGLRVNYNFTDWLAVGVYGGFAPGTVGFLHPNTGLAEQIQEVNQNRIDAAGGRQNYISTTVDGRLTATNLGSNFQKQIAQQEWMAAPQITLVPFRGKIAFFGSLVMDTDLYFFAGAAFVGLRERAFCGDVGEQCKDVNEREAKMEIAPTFGLGLTFYANRWNALGIEYRAYPYNVNVGGFDVAGGGEDDRFPDDRIDDKDREFRFNQMLTLSWNFYFPLDYRVSD